jgi:glycosyltransferase involved in cell wall biosynthesis
MAAAPGDPAAVVCLSIADWDAGFVQRSHHLHGGLARAGHRVFHGRTSFHQAGPEAQLQPIADRLFALRLPGPRSIDPARAVLEGADLERALAALDGLRVAARLEDVLCWVELPFWAPLALAARERFGWRVIYDCMDDHREFETTGAAMLRHEERLVAESDLVVASSRALHDRFLPRARRTLLLPNATDFDHWSHPAALDPLPAVPAPVIGYFGTIAAWLDVEMLLDAAARRPTWHFVLIGDVLGIDDSALRRRTNVHLLGREPYLALPSFLARFDVACIPFRKTALTRSVDPVKFYEYLSAGKPVVATALPELEPHRTLFYPLDAESEFVPQIEAALAEAQAPDRLERVARRREFARCNTWEVRQRVLEEALATLGAAAAEPSIQAREA